MGIIFITHLLENKNFEVWKEEKRASKLHVFECISLTAIFSAFSVSKTKITLKFEYNKRYYIKSFKRRMASLTDKWP